MTDKLMHLFGRKEVNRMILLVGLRLALAGMLMTGLTAIGVETLIAICVTLLAIAAEWHALSEIRTDHGGRDRWLSQGWIGFYVIVLISILLPATIGAWQMINGQEAARQAHKVSQQTVLSPALDSVQSAATRAVSQVDKLSRQADALVDMEAATGGVCSSERVGGGSAMTLLQNASGRYATLAQTTRRQATSVRILAQEAISRASSPQERLPQIGDIGDQLLRDAQSLDDESARFRDGTPFVSVVEGSAPKCTNQDLAGSLAATAGSLRSFQSSLSRYVQSIASPGEDTRSDGSTVTFGQRFGIYELVAILIALLTECGIVLLVFSGNARTSPQERMALAFEQREEKKSAAMLPDVTPTKAIQSDEGDTT